MNLCPECDIRLKTQWAKESAWKHAASPRRIAVRALQGIAIALGFACGSILIWTLEPAYKRLLENLWMLGLLIGAALGAYLSYEKASDLKRQVEKTADPVVGWYRTTNH